MKMKIPEHRERDIRLTSLISPGLEVSLRGRMPIFGCFSNLAVSVAAEYLAKGYALSDSILERAIEIDSEY